MRWSWSATRRGVSTPDKVTVRVAPTIFYKKLDGELGSWWTCLPRTMRPSRHGRVELAVWRPQADARIPGRLRIRRATTGISRARLCARTKAVVAGPWPASPRQFPVELNPEKRWNLLLVPHMHLDIGYTGAQGKIAEIQSRSLDEAMQLVRDQPDFRYSMDAFWVLQKLLGGPRHQGPAGTPPPDEGAEKSFSPPSTSNLLTHLAGVETLIRSLYPSFGFARKNGLDFDYANLTDVPSASRSYASVWPRPD